MPSKIAGLLGRRVWHAYERWMLRLLYRKAFHQQGKPDVLYSHYLNVSYYALTLHHTYHIPHVVIEHWSELNKPMLPHHVQWLGWQTYPQVDARITVSPSLQASLKKHFNVPSQVVYNIVGSEFHHNPSIQPPPQPVIFVSVGFLIERKRIDIALKAFAQLQSRPKTWQYIVIGEGEKYQELNQLTQQLGIQEYVRFLGQQDKQSIANILQRSHALILSSQLETFSVVCIEAMACGLPVIATKCGGPEHFVQPTDGLLCPINDVDAMAQAISHMMEHHEEYDRKKIAEDCQRRFGPQVIARQLTQVFESVLR